MKLIELPFWKKKNSIPLLGKPEILRTPRDLARALDNEIKKERPSKERIKIITKKLLKQNGEKEVYKKVEGPLLFFMRNNGTTNIYEKAQGGGTISVERSDGKEIYINLPRNKMQMIEYGGETIQAWFAHEENAIAYPYNEKNDSRELRNIITGIVTNHANLDDIGELKEKRKIIETIIFGAVVLVIIIFIVAPLLGINVINLITTKTAEVTTNALPPNIPTNGGL